MHLSGTSRRLLSSITTCVHRSSAPPARAHLDSYVRPPSSILPRNSPRAAILKAHTRAKAKRARLAVSTTPIAHSLPSTCSSSSIRSDRHAPGHAQGRSASQPCSLWRVAAQLAAAPNRDTIQRHNPAALSLRASSSQPTKSSGGHHAPDAHEVPAPARGLSSAIRHPLHPAIRHPPHHPPQKALCSPPTPP